MDNSVTYGGVPMPGRKEPDRNTPVPPTANLEVDDSRAANTYANFCRLTGSPEELLIDFGLNPHPTGTPTQPLVISQRVVTGWHTAKRLLQVLQLSVERHEAFFGVVKMDVQKRIRRR